MNSLEAVLPKMGESCPPKKLGIDDAVAVTAYLHSRSLFATQSSSSGKTSRLGSLVRKPLRLSAPRTSRILLRWPPDLSNVSPTVRDENVWFHADTKVLMQVCFSYSATWKMLHRRIALCPVLPPSQFPYLLETRRVALQTGL
jgi:hypothetical protein